MPPLDMETQRFLVRQRMEAMRLLDEMRRKRLRGMPHDPLALEALLLIGDLTPRRSRLTSGLVEMQRRMRAAYEASRESKSSGEAGGADVRGSAGE